MELDNKIIGRNIAHLRKLRDMKASDMAERMHLSEAAYTKHERGETANTLEFIQKVSKELDIDPLKVLMTTPANIVENLTNSPFAINGTLTTTNEQQNTLMLKLMESVVTLNENILELLQKRK